MPRRMKQQRRIWTDEQKEELIRAAPQNGLATFLRGRKINSEAWFRRMRTLYLERHPAFRKSLNAPAPVAAPAPAAPAPAEAQPPAAPPAPLQNFVQAPTEVKYEMVREYDKLLTKEERDAWREAHGASQPNLQYHRIQMRKKGMDGIHPPVGNHGGGPKKKYATEAETALVAEYQSLVIPGSKSAWLKTHNLNHQQIFEMKKRVRAQSNGNLPAVRATTAASAKPTPQQEAPAHDFAHIPSLEDGVRYLEIKRDIFNEVISDLQRVCRGPR